MKVEINRSLSGREDTGHKTHIMTQRYSHHYPGNLRRAMEILETPGYDTIKLHSELNQGGGIP